jgi:5-methyltetrahydrofolate--homocysteine methyltransferase
MEDAVEAFAEQAIALAEGGADVMWIETMSSVEELTAAVTGAGRSGLPIAVTLSFDTNGRTMMGVTPAQVAELANKLEPRPIAYGGNCGTGAAELMAVLVNMREAAGAGDILIAKSNCGIPEFVEGAIHYTGTPELMADYACMALDAGIRIIGGCCGTTPMHLQAMHEALVSHNPGRKPSIEEIVTRLGPISKGAEKPLGSGDQPDRETAGRRRGGRRARPGRDTTPRF